MRRNIIAAVACGIFLIIHLVPFLSARDPASEMASLDKYIASSREAGFTQRYDSLLKAGDLQALNELTDVPNDKAGAEKVLALYRKFMPDDAPESIKFLGENAVQMIGGNGYKRTDVMQEYVFPGKAMITALNIEERGESFRVIGFRITPYKDSLENLSAFRFFGQDARHYIILAISITLVALNALALVMWIKTPDIRFKWVWLVVLFLGMGKVEYNWVTGITYYFGNYGKGFVFDFIKLPIVSYSLSAYQPLVITMAIPVGTILFLIWNMGELFERPVQQRHSMQ